MLVRLEIVIVACHCKAHVNQNHSEAQIVNFRRWSSIPDVHLYPKNRPKNSHSSSLEYYNT